MSCSKKDASHGNVQNKTEFARDKWKYTDRIKMIGNWTLHYSTSPQAVTAVYAAVFLFSLINNILVLVALYRLNKLRPLHHFMIGLAATTILVLVPYGISMVTVALGYINLTFFSCTVIGIIEMISICATLWIHSCICLEKCASVLLPVRHRAFSLSSRLHLIWCNFILLRHTCGLLCSSPPYSNHTCGIQPYIRFMPNATFWPIRISHLNSIFCLTLID